MLQTELTNRLGITYPIVQAPMAGGITTTELVEAVYNSGGLGSIGAGYMLPDLLQKQISELKEKRVKTFNVNLFVPERVQATEDEVNRAKKALTPFYESLNIKLKDISVPSYSDLNQTYQDQIDVVIKERVPVVSFTFGLPQKEIVQILQDAGSIVMGTATTTKEAKAIEQLGMDFVIVQGSEAGGHRGNFLQEVEESQLGLIALIPQVVDAVSIPVIAAGGIMDGRTLVAALALGAEGVQMGTAFLTTTESGAHPLHKKSIVNAKGHDTVLTTTFSGKHARGIKNDFIEKMVEANGQILPYPLQNTLTQPLRAEAQKQNHSEYMSLWSGQAPQLAKEQSVEELIHSVTEEAKERLEKLE